MVEAPTLEQAITFLTQSVLLLTAFFTAAAYFRKRSRELAETALMFAALGVTTLVSWTGSILATRSIDLPSSVRLVSALAFMANPYLMVRIVKQFRRVPITVEIVAATGLVVSYAYLIYANVTGLETQVAAGEPDWRVLLGRVGIAALLGYLVFCYLYAAYAFLDGAYRSSGIARKRLNFAAAGTGLFAVLFLVAGIAIVTPALTPGFTAVAGGLFFIAILAFYLGFSPPRWLRRSWQLEELDAFVRQTTGRSAAERADGALRQLQDAGMRLTGATACGAAEPRDATWQISLRSSNAVRASAVNVSRTSDGSLGRALASRRARVVDVREAMSPAVRAIMERVDATHLALVPVATPEKVWRLLIIPLERLPLFLDESIEVLRVLADQTAVALDVQAFAAEQEELRFREARLASEELRRQNLAMQEATRLKSEFLANMSHELRTPLNGIIGFADLMASGKVGELAPDHTEYMQDILTSARHLLQLINDVLDLAKVEAGRMEFRPERVDPRELIEEALVIVRPLAQKKSIDLRVESDPKLGLVEVDPLRFKQATYNYVSNAIKFTPENGRVTVRIRPEGNDRFRVEVVDTGIGIKPEEIPKLFHEFQQLDAGMAKHHQGTGLGLALVRRLAEAQGGTVGVTSTLGKGSTFFLTLPRASDVASSARVSADDAMALGTRVLVVDDEETDREGLALILRAQGYVVDTVSTGRGAIEKIRTIAYDAATIDLLLPDMHGYEIIKALRERTGSRVAVIIVTQLSKQQVRVAYPVEGIFQKPVDPEELTDAFRRLGLGPSTARPVLVVDDDGTMRRLVETHLRALGYRAVLAADGQEALDAIRSEVPSLIVLDLVMPRMDGFAFLDEYRRTGGGAPVIVWTSKDLTADEIARLKGQVQIVAFKADGGSFALANRLEEALKRR